MGDIVWVLIPLAPFIVGGLAIWTRHQRQMLDKQSEMTAEKAAQYAAHTERLEERVRSEEHTSELQSLMRISYAVFCLKKKKQKNTTENYNRHTTTTITIKRDK